MTIKKKIWKKRHEEVECKVERQWETCMDERVEEEKSNIEIK